MLTDEEIKMVAKLYVNELLADYPKWAKFTASREDLIRFFENGILIGRKAENFEHVAKAILKSKE